MNQDDIALQVQKGREYMEKGGDVEEWIKSKSFLKSDENAIRDELNNATYTKEEYLWVSTIIKMLGKN